MHAKTQKTSANVQAFIDAMPPERRPVIQALHEFIIANMPGASVHIWGKLIGYGQYHYKYASGREGDWPPVALASGVQYISLYILGFENGKPLVEGNKDRLGKVSLGKSCIRFKKLEDLNLDVAAELIQKSYETMEGKTIGPELI